MQNSLTIESGFFPIRETSEVAGFSVPWEVYGYYEDFLASENGGGLFDLSSCGVLEVSGPDAQDYLQRMSTADLRALGVGHLVPGALLTGKGGVVSWGVFLRTDEPCFHLLVGGLQKEDTRAHLEKFHFGERLTISDVSSKWVLLGLWHPSPALMTEFGFPAHDRGSQTRRRQVEGMDFRLWWDGCRGPLLWIKIERAQGLAFLEWLRTFDFPLLGHRLFEYFRIHAGVPEVGREVGERDLILEAGGETAVARNKGCYPGQEVVERIFTYGQVNRRLMRMELRGEIPKEDGPRPLTLEGREAGTLVSWIVTPEDPFHGVALAYVRKPFWDFPGPLEAGRGLEARLVLK